MQEAGQIASNRGLVHETTGNVLLNDRSLLMYLNING